MNVTADQFLKIAYDWMCANVAAIEGQWPQKGGWEKWAQGEIIRAINAVDPTAMAQAEQHVYMNPAKSIDFMLNNPETSIADVVLCELKCQSLLNASNFVSGLREDVYYIDHDMKPPFGMASRIVLGFYFTEHFTLPSGFEFTAQTDPTNSVGMCYIKF